MVFTYKNKWFTALLILSIFVLVFHFFKQFQVNTKYEGFTQTAPFALKLNNDIYDSYYAEIYDDLYNPETRVEYEYKSIIDMTHPTQENSVFLDVGSGTGGLVNKLTENGYQANGIDTSQAMIDISQRKFPKLETKCGNIQDSMVYNKNTFTHITCIDFTVYHILDKMTFFRNCYQWLMPNGYLFVHLVDKDKYNPIVPAANPILFDNPQKYASQRITDSAVDFIGFKYKNSCNFKKDGCEVVVKETFKDTSSGNVRQNELTLFMDELKNIVFMVQRCGFIAQGMVKMKNDEHQYIYVFEKQI